MKKDYKKTICVTVEPKQQRVLKDLSDYTGKNISEIVRALIPSADEIEAFMDYQDFCDSIGDIPHHKEILAAIRKTKTLFFSVVMSGFIKNIGLQVAAVSYFDKDGTAIARLFSSWLKAVQGKEPGYRFVTDKYKLPDATYGYYYVLSPGETKQDIGAFINKFSMKAPDGQVNEAFTQGRFCCGKTKTKKKSKVSRVKQFNEAAAAAVKKENKKLKSKRSR